MRCDLGAERLGHGRDLSSLGNAATASRVQLQDSSRTSLQQASELIPGREALPGSDRDRGRSGDGRHPLHIIGRNRLLEPEWVEGLEATGEARRARWGELSVCTEQQVSPRADRGPNPLQELR